MKIAIALVFFAVVFISCNNNNASQKTDSDDLVHREHINSSAMSGHVAQSDMDLSHLKFASDNDTACGMPLSTGVTDTLVLNGKVYGFCTPACKTQFAGLLAGKKASHIIKN